MVWVASGGLGSLVWGGERQLEKTFKGQGWQGGACRGSFLYAFSPSHDPLFGSQVAARRPARLWPGRGYRVIERWRSGPGAQAGLTQSPPTPSSGCKLQKPLPPALSLQRPLLKKLMIILTLKGKWLREIRYYRVNVQECVQS